MDEIYKLERMMGRSLEEGYEKHAYICIKDCSMGIGLSKYITHNTRIPTLMGDTKQNCPTVLLAGKTAKQHMASTIHARDARG